MPMPAEQGFKRLYAEDLAAGLDFEWDYQEAKDFDLYEALEACGYTWDGYGWYTAEAMTARRPARRGRGPGRKTIAREAELLRQWNQGESIRQPEEEQDETTGS